jgi:broad specificity phosphatase PhoE
MVQRIKFPFFSLLITSFLIFSGFVPGQSDDIKTFILVRHAEKANDGRDPELSEEGEQRVLLLTEMLDLVEPDAIYTTHYIRTRETIQQIANQKNLAPIQYDPQSQSELVQQWLEIDGNTTILVSGHSNTIPELANLLLNRTHFEENFDESDYGNLLIITITNNDSKILHLRF